MARRGPDKKPRKRCAPTERLRPTKSPTLHDIVWAAGIYEGEGTCWALGTSTGIHVTQKDPWILERLRERFGGSVARRDINRGRFYVYRWTLYGARAVGFLLTIFSILSPRRRAQAKQALGLVL